MKKIKFKHYIEYYLLLFVNFLISRLSFKTTYYLCDKIGSFFYYYSFIRKKTVFHNLKIVFKNKSSIYYNRIAKQVCINFTKTFFEFFKLDTLNADNISNYVKSYNFNIIDDELKKGNGVILLSAHVDNWELIGTYLAIKGYDVYALAKSQKNKLADNFILKKREHSGLKIVLKGSYIKELFRILRKNKIAGMIGDVRGKDSEMNSTLFGEPVNTPEGTALMAYKTGASIVPIFIYRDKFNKHHLIVQPPITSEFKNKSEYARDIILKYNKILEEFVINHPDQWFYFHKRFKIKKP